MDSSLFRGENEESWFDATALTGNRILLEVDTSSRYERAVKRIAADFSSKGDVVYVFSWKGSPVYKVLSSVESVNLRTMTTDVSYSKQLSKKEIPIPQGDRAGHTSGDEPGGRTFTFGKDADGV